MTVTMAGEGMTVTTAGEGMTGTGNREGLCDTSSTCQGTVILRQSAT